jgi:hypothetical protein
LYLKSAVEVVTVPRVHGLLGPQKQTRKVFVSLISGPSKPGKNELSRRNTDGPANQPKLVEPVNERRVRTADRQTDRQPIRSVEVQTIYKFTQNCGREQKRGKTFLVIIEHFETKLEPGSRTFNSFLRNPLISSHTSWAKNTAIDLHNSKTYTLCQTEILLEFCLSNSENITIARATLPVASSTGVCLFSVSPQINSSSQSLYP